MDLFRCYHAPATFAFCDRGLTLQLVLPDEESHLEAVDLVYRVEGNDQSGALRMLPMDGIVQGESYSVYAATLGADVLRDGERLSYHFALEGEEGTAYSVPLMNAPHLPPVMISEYFPFGGGPVRCIELYNPLEETVDLYDYELVCVDGENCILGRNPLADAPSVNLLESRSIAALNFISSDIHTYLAENNQQENPTFAYLASVFPESCEDIAERGIKWMEVDLCEKNDEGDWVAKPGCFDLYHWIRPRRLRIVPRGGDADSAFFAMDINMRKDQLQTRKLRSSRWTVDLRDPSVGICTVKRDLPTPGFADPYQFLPNSDDSTVPAILPLSPVGRVHLASGDLSVCFAIAGENIAMPTVYVKENGAFVPYPAAPGKQGVFEVTVPFQKLARMEKLEYYIEVTGGLYTASLGSAEEPCVRRITDNAGPAILRTYPAEGQILEKEHHPEIKLEYFDISGVNLKTSILCVDGRNVSAAARWEEGCVTYRPERALVLGEHTFEVSLRDKLGNRTYQKIAFGICDGTEMQCYRGEVHSHTGDSDGCGSVEDAMTYARDVGGADYFAVTDHSHYTSIADIRAQRTVADRFNQNGSFATTHGFEMTWNYGTGYWGHMNVLNTDWVTQYHDEVPLPALYDMLKKDPDAIGIFNHPCEKWGNFDEFEGWDPEIDKRICLAEINGSHFDRNYALMLSKGWHASPVYNEDTHGPTWTTATNSTGYVLAPSLTRENVIEAFRKRRTYTTGDNQMKIFYRVNGEWMGSRLQNPDKLTVDIKIHTDSENGIGQLSLVTEDNIIVARINAGPLRDFSWQIEIDPDFDYYYLRIQNGKIYSATAPVFIEGRDLLNITDLSYGICAEDVAMSHVIEATVRNDSDKPMKDVTVDYYLTPIGGFELRDLVPFTSVHIGKLEAGETHTVARRFPAIALHRRVTVMVNGWQGRDRFADTTYRMITPLLISKVMPSTTPITVGEECIENPFPYVEIYNPSPVDLNLNKYVMRLRNRSGQNPLPEHSLPLDGFTLPAGKSLTIWVKPTEGELTADDFNARYDTALVEGEDLIVTTNRVVSASEKGKRIELMFGEEMITYAPTGRYCSAKTAVVQDVPLLYGDHRRLSLMQSTVKDMGEGVALPGEILASQMPAPKKGEISPREEKEEQRAQTRNKVITRLSKVPLVPLQAAKMIARAASALKDIFSAKE